MDTHIFQVIGVNRSSGEDALLTIDALNEANARAKAELQGIVVTSVQRTDACEDHLVNSPTRFPLPEKVLSTGPNGIGGWLILPAIGLIVSPLIVCAGIAEGFKAINGTDIARAEAQFPGIRSAVLGEIILQVVFLAFQVFTAVNFFMKKRIVPRLMIVLFSANVVLSLAAVAWITAVVGPYPDGVIEVAKASVVAAIWIPYFVVSKRVRNTFV